MGNKTKKEIIRCGTPYQIQVKEKRGNTYSASIRLTIRKGLVFDEGTTDAEKIIKLVEAIKYIYEELDENRQHADGKYDTLIKLLNDTTNRLNSESKRLEALSKEIATGDVRPQLISILLIGFGTLLAAIPTICALFF